MNEEVLNTMPDYVKNLPKNVRDFVFDGVWEERTEEIALKYSLDDTQTDSLINKVLFVLIGFEKPEEFVKTLDTDLNISKLLTAQIIEDIEKRVFQYAVIIISAENTKTPEVTLPKFVPPQAQVTKKVEEIKKSEVVEEKIEPKVESIVIEAPKVTPSKESHTDFDVVRSMSKDIEYLKNGQDPVMHTAINKESVPEKVEEKNVEQPVVENKIIPEVRPDISPVVESVKQTEKVQINNVPHNLPGMEIEENTAQVVVPQVKIDDLGDDKVFVGSEFIKESETVKENVPRNTEIKPAPPKWGSNINGGSTIEPKIEKVPEEVKISVPKYTADPYREPIE